MDSWKLKIKEILEGNVKACEAYENAHSNKAEHYKTIFHVTTLLSTVVVFINFLLSTLVSSNAVNHPSITIIVAVLSAIIGTGNIINIYYCNPAEKLTQHIECKNDYKRIINKIELEIVFGLKDKSEAEEFTKEICKEMIELEADPNTPSIYDKKELNNQRVLKRIYRQRSGLVCKEPELKSDIENNISERRDISDNKVVEKVAQNIGIKGLSEEENIDFSILYNPAKLQFLRDCLNE